MRLCMTNRFSTAASMSRPVAGVKFVGLHSLVFQTFVHGNEKLRSAFFGVCAKAVLLLQASNVIALLPTDVRLEDSAAFGTTSHGYGLEAVSTTRVQPATGVQHHVSRMSVLD